VADAGAKLKEMQLGSVSKSVANAEAARARNVTGTSVACVLRASVLLCEQDSARMLPGLGILGLKRADSCTDV